jgi:hypothetical protein
MAPILLDRSIPGSHPYLPTRNPVEPRKIVTDDSTSVVETPDGGAVGMGNIGDRGEHAVRGHDPCQRQTHQEAERQEGDRDP